MDTMNLVRQVEKLIETGNRLLIAGTGGGTEETLNLDDTGRFHRDIESFVEEIHGRNHHLAGELSTECDKNSRKGIKKGITVPQTVRQEVLYAAEFGL